jgi:hypothetical protein
MDTLIQPYMDEEKSRFLEKTREDTKLILRHAMPSLTRTVELLKTGSSENWIPLKTEHLILVWNQN